MQFQVDGVRVNVAWDAVLAPVVLAIIGLAYMDLHFIALAPVWLVIMFVHEWGHAAVVRHYRGDVLGLDLHAFHGLCRYTAPHLTYAQRVHVAWGGVAAQTVIGLPVWWLLSDASLGRIGDAWVDGFGYYNLMIAAINLLPIEPLDGALAWKILRR